MIVLRSKLRCGLLVIIGIITVGAASIYSLGNIGFGSCKAPDRLVIIRGKVLQLDHPTLGKTNAIGTLVFQKVGCDACNVGAPIDTGGRYQIVVGDGKYRVMYMDPISDVDHLAPDQAKFIDTEAIENKQVSKTVFDFDVNLITPKIYLNSSEK